jgi:hypothetical protein
MARKLPPDPPDWDTIEKQRKEDAENRIPPFIVALVAAACVLGWVLGKIWLLWWEDKEITLESVVRAMLQSLIDQLPGLDLFHIFF